jgi:catechol 2,3-dioxygenase-like lactoylglutathione lyase family enzyme
MQKFTLRFIFGIVGIASAVVGQTAPAPAGEVLGVGNFIHSVTDVVKSLEFYHDVLGMDLQGPAGTQVNMPRPYAAPAEIVNLYNAVGGEFRVGVGLVPEAPMRAELVEWHGVERKPVPPPRVQDPGATFLILTVRDLDAVMARVKKSGTPIATTGGEPVALAEGKAILLKDPDGFFVEVMQKEGPAGPSNLVDVSWGVTVSDTDRMMHVFKDALGFQPVMGTFQSDKTRAKFLGLKGAHYRDTTALVPGSSFQVHFFEFKGKDIHPVVQSRPQDPGTPVLRLRVRDEEATLKALAAVGVHVASHGGEFVTLRNPVNTQRAAIVSAPDNLFMQILQVIPNSK